MSRPIRSLPARPGSVCSARHTRRERRVLLTAAVMIAQTAATLHDCHTIKGKWPRAEREVKDDYLRMLLVAQALLKMRGKGP